MDGALGAMEFGMLARDNKSTIEFRWLCAEADVVEKGVVFVVVALSTRSDREKRA